MASLLDTLTSLAAPAVGRIAQRLGESDSAVSRGLEASVATVLGGLLTKSTDGSAAHRIFDLITSASSSGVSPDDVSKLLGGSPAPATGNLGTSLLTTLFGNRVASAGELIARTAGFKNPSSGPSILGVAAPLVLGYFGKRLRDGSLSLGSLTSLLSPERDNILAVAPPGLSSLLDLPGPTARAIYAEVPRSAPERDRAALGMAPQPRNNRWLWPLLALAAILLIWFTVRGQRPTVTSIDTAVAAGTVALDSPASRASAPAPATAPATADSAGSLGAFATKSLPGGVALSVPERGIESNLITFIIDSTKFVDTTTWFNFDRLTFATGSAQILPQSDEQLNNIAAVLKAFPSVNVKIGGYTDNTGNAAANRRLSQQRADAVKKALVGKGISPRRMSAEGYGADHALADNGTEDGRAQNRRIALRVTKK